MIGLSFGAPSLASGVERLRGCRLGITDPEIIEMQTRAVLEAALDAQRKGVTVLPQLMIPLIGTAAEFTHQANIIRTTAAKVFKERNATCNFKVREFGPGEKHENRKRNIERGRWRG